MRNITGRSIRMACSIAAAFTILSLAPVESEAVLLPTANCGTVAGSNCLEFGDFNVFSLPLLNLQSGGDAVPSPGDAYFAPSTFGAIQDFTIVGINNGQDGAGNIPGEIDGSYNTPSNQTADTFSTKTTADPGGAGEFANDSAGSWDALTGSILSLTNNTPLVFFFAFNETGSGTGLLNTDLLIWGKVTLVGAGGTAEFLLGRDPGAGATPLDSALPSAGGTNTDFDDPLYDFGPWVYVHAGICVVGTDFVGFPLSDGTCAFGTVANQNNLGQNAAAFMVNSPALDLALLSGNYTTMQVVWEMAYINGGGETAWIMPVATDCPPGSTDPLCRPITVPEPGILALIGLALGSLGAIRRIRTRS